MDLLQPEYNILKTAGSRLGTKHSAETRAKMADTKKGKNHPMFGKTFSEEARAKMAAAKKGKKHPMFGKARAIGAGKPSQKIEVFDIINNQATIYDSIQSASKALNIDQSTISKYLRNNQKSPYKKKYIFKRIEI